jgi:hypothetical protein
VCVKKLNFELPRESRCGWILTMIQKNNQLVSSYDCDAFVDREHNGITRMNGEVDDTFETGQTCLLPSEIPELIDGFIFWLGVQR